MENFKDDFKHCLEEIKLRIPVSSIVGKRVKLKKVGREFIGLSPFSSEKTPSFTVNDEKKFWHCFSSGLHGDIFSFLQRLDHRSFPEAVEILAHQAGIPVPQFSFSENESPVDKTKDELKKIMQAATQFYQKNLHDPHDEEAYRYLANRGITKESMLHFSLGFAPETDVALKTQLIKQGFLFEDIKEAGLIAHDESHSLSRDRFRGRVIFPIFNEKGEPIAFGGRILTTHPKRPKYLNSTQTPLFQKGDVLYNYHLARKASGKEKVVYVVEGYMDAIALYQAGFKSVVASMGTALTENQLYLLWRLSPSPILCFDGDNAGLHASFRVIERALPLLKPGYSLEFCLLPQGQDPFDIIQKFGPSGFESFIMQKKPLVDMLWHSLLENQKLETPEEKALFEVHAHELIEKIAHRTIRIHYKREIDRHIWHLFRAAPSFQKQKKNQKNSQNSVTNALKNSYLASPTAGKDEAGMQILLLTAIYHPPLLYEYGERLLRLPLANHTLQELRQTACALTSQENFEEMKYAQLAQALTERGFEKALKHLEEHPLAKNEHHILPDADFTFVASWFSNILEQWEYNQALQQNLDNLQNCDPEISLGQLRLLHTRLMEKKKIDKVTCS